MELLIISECFIVDVNKQKPSLSPYLNNSAALWDEQLRSYLNKQAIFQHNQPLGFSKYRTYKNVYLMIVLNEKWWLGFITWGTAVVEILHSKAKAWTEQRHKRQSQGSLENLRAPWRSVQNFNDNPTYGCGDISVWRKAVVNHAQLNILTERSM